jgi:TldD protein
MSWTEYALELATASGATYADVRLIDQTYQTIQTKNRSVSALNEGQSQGIGIRVLLGGWGFSSTRNLTKAGIKSAVKRALETARASASCVDGTIELAAEPCYQASWISPHLIDPFGVPLEKKLDILFEAARMMLAVKGVTLAQGAMSFIKEIKHFASSEGTLVKQTFIRSGCGIEAYATGADDQQRRTYPQAGGQHELSGWEMVLRHDLAGNAERIAEEAVQLLKAPQCPQATMDLVLGSSQLALQIHESCGHPSELDRALRWEINFAGSSFLVPEERDKLVYGSPIVNLVADATASGALGSFAFDDEGVAAQRNYIVKDGIFTGYLSSRDTAHLIGLSRSGGNMRAESWQYTPIIRMTNISLVPGRSGSLAEIISDTKNGIYMETNKSWSIDGRRYNFQFSTEMGREIKNGKLGRLFKNASYSGFTPGFWRSCDAIGDKSDYIEWGLPNCGKGQPMQTMWTGHGASPSRFRKVQVGIAHSG